mmetsp:Transcript_377/g.961  ORF Transcript_377/g.961 Transcript_377/m.961 type:complete len:277 (+) Transcript_377:759-1589(+)
MCTSSEEKKSICFGDSGGPLLQKGLVDDETGTRVDTHVGVASFLFGAYDEDQVIYCGLRLRPDIFARTSSGIDFIKDTICVRGKSRSPFCQEPVLCNNEDEQKLVIKVVTDIVPDNIQWVLSKTDIDQEIMLTRSDYDEQYFTYEDSICLPRGEQYKFEINEVCVDGAICKGFYSLRLDGKELKSSRNEPFENNDEYRFSTDPFESPDPCLNDANYRFKNMANGKTCNEIKVFTRGRKKKRKRICQKVDQKNGNKKVRHFCPSVCVKACRTKNQNH